MRWVVRLTGKAAHSSMPHLGVNAITYAGHLLGELARIEAELKAAGQNAALRSALHHPAGDAARRRQRLQHRARGLLVRLGDPPAARLRRHGARRPLPPLRRGECLAPCGRPRRKPASTSRSSTRCRRSRPMPPPASCPSPSSSPSRTTPSPCATPPRPACSRRGGAPSVVCGPGDIAQAHTPDEYIEIAELEKCLAFLGRVADWAEADVSGVRSGADSRCTLHGGLHIHEANGARRADALLPPTPRNRQRKAGTKPAFPIG